MYDPSRYYSPAKTWLKGAAQFLITFIASGAALEIANQMNATAGGLPDTWAEFQTRWPVLLAAFGAAAFKVIQNYYKHRDTPRAPQAGENGRYGIALLLIPLLAFSVTGCATMAETEFRDGPVDAPTVYKAKAKAGPFGTLDTTNQRVGYSWNQTDGKITVGQDAQGLDNSGQIQALQATTAMITDLIKVLGPLMAAQSAGLPTGGGTGGGPLGTLLERHDQLCELACRFAPERAPELGCDCGGN